jgi:hypothetical protein
MSAVAAGYAARYVAATYHGKVLRTEAARVLVTLDHDLTAGPMEQVVPYRVARDIVVKNPAMIVAYECACRAARDAAEDGSAGRRRDCGPLDVCLVIGSPLAEFVLSVRPDKSRLIDRPQALSLLDDAHRRGNVPTAWFKEAAFRRLSLCNCCSCCLGLSAMRGRRAVAPSGYVALVGRNCATAAPPAYVCAGGSGCVPTATGGPRGTARIALKSASDAVCA